MDTQLLNRHVLPDEPWAARIFRPEVFGADAGFSNVFTTNNCTIECRLMPSGKDWLLALPCAQVPGDSFGTKRTNLARMTVDNLEQLMQQASGSLLHAEENDMVYMIPSGMMLLQGSPEHSRMLRWGSALTIRIQTAC